jgi:hypothetical protein
VSPVAIGINPPGIGKHKTDNSEPGIKLVICGRFTLRSKLNILLAEFSAAVRDEELELRPRYDIPPSTIPALGPVAMLYFCHLSQPETRRNCVPCLAAVE